MKTGFIIEIQKQLTRAGSKNICISTRIRSQKKNIWLPKMQSKRNIYASIGKFMQILTNLCKCWQIQIFSAFPLDDFSFREHYTKKFFIFVFRFVAHESLICTNAIHNTINFVLMKMFCENSLCFAQFIISPISSFENISS